MAAETVGTEAAKPRVRAPQQGRSRETYERIIRTTRALMDGRDYETISVNEICEASDVSHSSFYARFENKEALILHVHEAHRAERMQRLSRYVTDVDWDALSLQGIARACLALYIEDRRALEPFLRSLMLAELRYPHAAEERAEVDRRGIDLIRGRIMSRLERDDEALARRIEFGIWVACTSAQEAIRPPSRFGSRLGVSDEALANELSLVFCRYVGLDTDDVARDEVEEIGGGAFASGT